MVKRFLCERTLQQSRNLYLNIPRIYSQAVGLKKGDKVVLYIQKDKTLLICKKKVKKERKVSVQRIQEIMRQRSEED